ncbi:MAG: BTAD domain-containing putative transcriptional regulator, partial [Actinomycetota bacterium]
MLSYRILGPVEVLRDGYPLPLGSAKQRALLVCLLIRRGQTVPAGQLVDDLWADDPPPSAEHQIHVYVSRLRKILDEDGRRPLVTRAPGYALELGDDDAVDADVFEGALRHARGLGTERAADALAALDGALSAWRGPALADLQSEPFAGPVATRLEELRAVGEEERVAALLTLGRHAETIPELEALVARYPLRERLRELQMLALYRAGRQAEALTAFETARRTLAEELGIDPSPTLRSLEGAILRHDEDLAAPPRVSVEPTDDRPDIAIVAPVEADTGPAAPSSRVPRFVLVGAVGVAIVVLGAWALARSDGARDRSSRSPSASTPSNAPVSLHRLQWFAVPSMGTPPSGATQIVLGAAHAEGGYVACGITTQPGLGTLAVDPSIWVATGAPTASWTLVPGLAAPGSQRAVDVVPFQGHVVVVGADGSSGAFRPAVWVSNAAMSTWHRADERGVAFTFGAAEATSGWIRGVAFDAADRLLVAVGSTESPTGEDASVWTSSDGEHWNHSIAGGLQGPADTVMTDVVALHGGALVAVGSTMSGAGDEDAAVWLSPDGARTWKRAPSEFLGGPGQQQINAVVAHGGDIVAVGEETLSDDTNAAVWVSHDGLSWMRVRRPAAFNGPNDQRMFTAAWDPGAGIVAAGAETIGTNSDALVWTSSDGTTWHREAVSTATTSLNGPGDQTVKVVIDT